ncbi:MAG TPA: hypothetical protein VFN26_14740 [Candidatus Acidoferrum sp.]|nr:hypothetical protein [Candidatus Acidoferrum sp.]
MKQAARIVFSTLISLILVTAGWAFPTTTNDAHSRLTNQDASAQSQSVSGKITAVAKDSFTLAVGSVATSTPGQQFQQQNSPKTMTFLIDKNTTVEGKLKVNANADVTYREDNGRYVAISVRVTP